MGATDRAWAIQDGIHGADKLLVAEAAGSLRIGSVCQEEVVFASAEGKHILRLRLDADTDPSPTPRLLLVRRPEEGTPIATGRVHTMGATREPTARQNRHSVPAR